MQDCQRELLWRPMTELNVSRAFLQPCAIISQVCWQVSSEFIPQNVWMNGTYKRMSYTGELLGFSLQHLINRQVTQENDSCLALITWWYLLWLRMTMAMVLNKITLLTQMDWILPKRQAWHSHLHAFSISPSQSRKLKLQIAICLKARQPASYAGEGACSQAWQTWVWSQVLHSRRQEQTTKGILPQSPKCKIIGTSCHTYLNHISLKYTANYVILQPFIHSFAF